MAFVRSRRAPPTAFRAPPFALRIPAGTSPAIRSIRRDALAVVRDALRAVEPAGAIVRSVRRDGASIRLPGRRLVGCGPRSVAILAIGKAAGAMLDGAHRRLGDRAGPALAVVPRGYPLPRTKATVRVGEHPVPGAGSFASGVAVQRWVADLDAGDRLLVLLSGGGSAVLETPTPAVSRAELRRTTRLLLASGMPIQGMNAVRRHLSALKGGGLGRSVPSEQWATLAISDVVGDAPWDIASGPTVPDPTTFRDALRTLDSHRLRGRLPAGVRLHLQQGAQGRLPETDKPGSAWERRASFHLIGSNRHALEAGARSARRRGYLPDVLTRWLTGDTTAVAQAHIQELRGRIQRGPRERTAWLSGGETTVRLTSRVGRGGRNLEFALVAAQWISGLADVAFLSLGSDGIDGTTDVAGGIVDGSTMARAKERGVDVASALRRHASYEALRRLGGLVKTGPTGTNVMDLHLLLSAGTEGSSRRGAARSSRRRRS